MVVFCKNSKTLYCKWASDTIFPNFNKVPNSAISSCEHSTCYSRKDVLSLNFTRMTWCYCSPEIRHQTQKIANIWVSYKSKCITVFATFLFTALSRRRFKLIWPWCVSPAIKLTEIYSLVISTVVRNPLRPNICFLQKLSVCKKKQQENVYCYYFFAQFENR